MPNYKGHVVGGTVAFALTLYLLRSHNPTFLTCLEWYFFTIVGCLFPDIDTKSKGQKFFYQLVFALAIFLLIQMRFLAVAVVSIVALLPLLIRHRGITHSLWFITCLSLFVIIYAHIKLPAFASVVFFDTLFFFVGALSHLWLDLGFRRMIK